MELLHSRFGVLGFVVAAGVSAQSELAEVVVDHFMRPGAHFATIQEGIDAVARGGRVVVRPYANYSSGLFGTGLPAALDIGKPLSLVAAGDPYHPQLAQRVVFGGWFRIHDIESGEFVHIDGIIHSSHGVDEIVDCSGCVRLTRSAVGGFAVAGVGTVIRRCQNVRFVDCWCQGGLDPLEVVDSNVVFEDCTVRPGTGIFQVPPGEFALLAGQGADITLIRTGVIGNLTWFPSGVQRPLQVDGGVVRVDAQSGLICSSRGGVAEYRYAHSRGVVWLDPGAQLQHGPVAASPGLLHRAVVRSVDATPVFEGGSYTATLRGGQAGDAFGVILAGPATGSPFPLVGLTLSQGVDPDYTLSWLDPSVASVLYFGPPVGTSASMSVGAAPAHSDITIQGAFLRMDGTVVLTPPFSQWVRPLDQLWR